MEVVRLSAYVVEVVHQPIGEVPVSMQITQVVSHGGNGMQAPWEPGVSTMPMACERQNPDQQRDRSDCLENLPVHRWRGVIREVTGGR